MTHYHRPTTLLTLFLGILPSAVSYGETIELPIWPGVAPGSAGISEKEQVVERGDGQRVIDRSIHDGCIGQHAAVGRGRFWNTGAD